MNIFEQTIDRGNLMYRLGLMARHWRQVLDAEFLSAGLTDAMWRPLLHLDFLGDGTRQKDLAASVGIECPSLVRLLDTLVAKGLIERSEDATDRRAKLLRLTSEGREIVVRIRETVKALESEILSPFTDGDIVRLAELIGRLESAVDDARRRGKR